MPERTISRIRTVVRMLVASQPLESEDIYNLITALVDLEKVESYNLGRLEALDDALKILRRN